MNDFSAPAGSRRSAAPAAEEVELRPLRSPEEYRACVELQRATWGAEFSELVPSIILKIAQRLGGVAAGAFDAEGRLQGFVFGMTGVENGRLVHWSDMLAVREEARDLGLGRRLKEHQREQVRALGVEVIYWTYDPLVARNAHLNLNRLGAEIVEYVQDMYGDPTSELHHGLGTDRCLVAWWIGGLPPPHRETEDAAGRTTLPVVNADPGEGDPPLPRDAEAVRIQIPLDIYRVRATAPAEAAQWREGTRRAFLHYLERGYRVTGFYRDDEAERGYYLLLPQDASEGGA